MSKWGQELKDARLEERKPGPKRNRREALVLENKKLRRKLEQIEKKLRKTELIVDLQKKTLDSTGDRDDRELRQRKRAMIEEHGKEIGVRELCEALGESRASFYRSRKPKQSAADRVSHRKLTKFEEERVLETLNSERFRDMAPGKIYATLLDEGIYLCSERSMYRILSRNKQNLQRRQSSPRLYTKPELLATAPNQLWSWDITKLKGPAKWTYFYLYKIIDVYSRFVVGWMVEYRETGALAKEFIDDTCAKQEILPNQLTLHADKGSSMTSRTVGQLLADLGVTKTHSRPHVSNDNPYSESAFKTLKYRPGFPECFGSIEDERAF